MKFVQAFKSFLMKDLNTNPGEVVVERRQQTSNAVAIRKI